MQIIKIIYKQEFFDNITNLKSYISLDSISIAKKFINKIFYYIEYLYLFPEMGTIVNSEKEIRKLIYGNYIILYQIDYEFNLVNVLTIFHSTMDINLILKNIQKYL